MVTYLPFFLVFIIILHLHIQRHVWSIMGSLAFFWIFYFVGRPPGLSDSLSWLMCPKTF